VAAVAAAVTLKRMEKFFTVEAAMAALVLSYCV
jgi:hypothetical protein